MNLSWWTKLIRIDGRFFAKRILGELRFHWVFLFWFYLRVLLFDNFFHSTWKQCELSCKVLHVQLLFFSVEMVAWTPRSLRDGYLETELRSFLFLLHSQSSGHSHSILYYRDSITQCWATVHSMASASPFQKHLHTQHKMQCRSKGTERREWVGRVGCEKKVQHCLQSHLKTIVFWEFLCQRTQ